jgi:hypothetical protein
VPSAFAEHRFDQVLFAYISLADVFDLDPGFLCQLFRVLSQFVAMPPLRIVASMEASL